MRFQLLNSHCFALVTLFLATCPFIFGVAAVPVHHGDGTHSLALTSLSALEKREVISWDYAMEQAILRELPRLNQVLGLLGVTGMRELSKKAFLHSHLQATKQSSSKRIYLSKDKKGSPIRISYTKLSEMVMISGTHTGNSKDGIRLLLNNGFLPGPIPAMVLQAIEQVKKQLSSTWMDAFRRYFAVGLEATVKYFDHDNVSGYVPTGANAQAGPSSYIGYFGQALSPQPNIFEYPPHDATFDESTRISTCC
ncbi:hypothetical protein C8Q75DRAFT_738048 [Abortiporus biennis]|nr:hypothetical protein C8Q75DRAFT_738048 [Abortiporus biennis]